MDDATANGLFANWWDLFGENWELLGSSRETLADAFGFLMSSNII